MSVTLPVLVSLFETPGGPVDDGVHVSLHPDTLEDGRAVLAVDAYNTEEDELVAVLKAALGAIETSEREVLFEKDAQPGSDTEPTTETAGEAS